MIFPFPFPVTVPFGASVTEAGCSRFTATDDIATDGADADADGTANADDTCAAIGTATNFDAIGNVAAVVINGGIVA